MKAYPLVTEIPERRSIPLFHSPQYFFSYDIPYCRDKREQADLLRIGPSRVAEPRKELEELVDG